MHFTSYPSLPVHTQSTYAKDCTITTTKNQKISPHQSIVIGVDEVGYGTLFGHMTVAAIILPDSFTGWFDAIDLSKSQLALINDSKKLTERKRQKLCDPIKTLCQSYALVDVPVHVIDTIDVHQAQLLGMRLAVETLITLNELDDDSDVTILVDGGFAPRLAPQMAPFEHAIETVVKGDTLHTSIACASILAKVHRDATMDRYALDFPEYGFENHRGYGTQAHRQAILTHGILALHRKSFNPVRDLIATGAATYYQKDQAH